MGGLIKRIVLALAFAIILLLTSNTARASGNTSISVNYPSNIEEYFVITIDIEPALGVTVSGVQFDFIWNTKAIEVNEIAQGNLFAEGYFNYDIIDNEAGLIPNVCYVSYGEGSGTMLKGTIATLACTRLALEPMDIRLSNVVVGDYKANELALEPYIINVLSPPNLNLPNKGGEILYSEPSGVSAVKDTARVVIPPALALGVVVMALRTGEGNIVGGFGSILLGVIVFVISSVILSL